jgi:transmembrane sensor
MFRRYSNPATPTDTALEAADWLVRLSDDDTDPDEPYSNALERQNAFFDWLERSPNHLRVFLETVETERRLRQLAPLRDIDVQAMLQRRSAEVIQLFVRDDEHPQTRFKAPPPVAKPSRLHWRRTVVGTAAALATLAIGGWLYVNLVGTNTYTTGFGEQRTCKLKDGSIVYLNTDSRVEVRFSQQGRDVWLVRGEALFVVEHDASRPFVVHAGQSQIRAVGTQFDVYRREDATTVSVVEGVVQVEATGSSAPQAADSLRVTAGEGADVHAGSVTAHPLQNVAGATSWRERRLVFTDAPLSEVAREFNRYNRTRIRVEGAAGDRLRLTGIFDADRPQALILYALKSNSLDVEPEGNDWVIRER